MLLSMLELILFNNAMFSEDIPIIQGHDFVCVV